MNEHNPYLEFLYRYRDDPVGFVQNVLHCTPDDWQADFLQAIADGHRKVTVRSGHGVGKSTASSWAMLWYMLTRFPVKVVVTAPTSAQLFDALFAELKRWVRELPDPLRELLDVTSDRVVLKSAPTEAFISARTSRAETPEALQGVHSDNVLLVADEASGIPEQVFEAAAGSMSGHNACTLLLGNPVRSSGYFYETHHRLKDEWKVLHVSCTKSDRVSDDYVREMAQRYGEDSNAFRIRVLGEFPLADDDTCIPMDLIQRAITRDIAVNPHAPFVWGLDVARFGSDSSAMCIRQANKVHALHVWKGLDLMELSGRVAAMYNDAETKPQEILIDSIGLGAGVVDRLRELNLPVRGVNVSEAPALKGTYANLRAELWFKTREWFESMEASIPNDARLVDELAMVRYKYTSNGKFQIESKDDIRKRGQKSPDVAESLVLTLSSDAVTTLFGSRGSITRKGPLKRNISGIV